MSTRGTRNTYKQEIEQNKNKFHFRGRLQKNNLIGIFQTGWVPQESFPNLRKIKIRTFKWSTCYEKWNKQMTYFCQLWLPLPAQPPPKPVDRHVPLVIRIVSISKFITISPENLFMNKISSGRGRKGGWGKPKANSKFNLPKLI